MLPYVFTIFGIHVPTYGLLVALAFLTGLAVTAKLARRSGLDSERVLNLAIYCAIAGIAGAKLLMIVVEFDDYAADPSLLFSLSTIQAAGIFYGGLIAALVTAYFYMRHAKLPPLPTLDALAPGAALGHAIGRLGCFAAGCCWGSPTDLPWGVTFTNPEANALTGVPLHSALHPTQLYEALGETVIFLILLRRFGRSHRAGAVFGLYLALYAALRFVSDFARDPQQANPFGGPFNNAQWISLGLMALAAFLWWKSRGSESPAPAPQVAERAGRKR
jgi:phosphatidylglycerol:prolipoprotein diacylglycerol transferase